MTIGPVSIGVEVQRNTDGDTPSRLIPARKGKKYSERLKRLGLPTLEYRRERVDTVEVYKIMNDIDLANKEKLFQIATSFRSNEKA